MPAGFVPCSTRLDVVPNLGKIIPKCTTARSWNGRNVLLESKSILLDGHTSSTLRLVQKTKQVPKQQPELLSKVVKNLSLLQLSWIKPSELLLIRINF
jgi:hypothetical protein